MCTEVRVREFVPCHEACRCCRLAECCGALTNEPVVGWARARRVLAAAGVVASSTIIGLLAVIGVAAVAWWLCVR